MDGVSGREEECGMRGFGMMRGVVLGGFVGLFWVGGFAQQAAPDSAVPSSATGTPAAAAVRTPPDARMQEKGLGLEPPANAALPSLVLIGDSTVRNGHGR